MLQECVNNSWFHLHVYLILIMLYLIMRHDIIQKLFQGLFVWSWASSVRRTSSPKWDLIIKNYYKNIMRSYEKWATPPRWDLTGCSYGGELARLGGLARLSEISPSLRNSYKNIMCSYEKWASPPRWDLTLFCWDPTRRDENFPYEHAQVGQPGKVG